MKFIFAFAGSFATGAIMTLAVPWLFAVYSSETGGLIYWLANAFQTSLPWLMTATLGLAGYGAVRWVFQERHASAAANAAADARALVAQAEAEARQIEQELMQEEEAVKARAREISIQAEHQAQLIRAEAEQIRADLQQREANLEEKRKSYRDALDRAEAALHKRNQTITNLVNQLDKKRKAIYLMHHDNPGRVKRTVKPLDKALAEAAELGFEPDHG